LVTARVSQKLTKILDYPEGATIASVNGPTIPTAGAKGRTQGPSGQPGVASGQVQGNVQGAAASGQSLNEILASTLGLDASAFSQMVNGNFKIFVGLIPNGFA
jgi:hypothetical protein